MHYPFFDLNTIILYVVIGLICIMSIHIAKGGSNSFERTIKGFTLLFITLFCFSVFRKIGLHLGGEDALRYQDSFINYFNHGAERYENTDILFGYLTGGIRIFTENPYIYRAICYSIIIIGYIHFIKNIAPQNISPIPFICILVPFMRSFGSMRNSISISLFLIAIVAFYNKNYLWCIIWTLCSVLMHRLSIIMLPLFPFLALVHKYFEHQSKIKFVLCSIVFIFISYLLSKLLQQYILLFSLFADNGNADLWYLTNKQDKNILLNWSMYLPHLLLFIALIVCYNNLPKMKNVNLLLNLFYFDIIVLPASLVLGMWRFVEYLYIPNLILWGILLSLFYKKVTSSSRILIQSTAFLGFTGLMCIRLIREWEDLSIMPYLFFWQ